MITKRVHQLADGRELIYFDDADSSLDPERAPDLRVLDERPATATMRQDPLTGEWISIAAARQNRVFMPPSSLDPLAPQTPDNPSEIPSNYDVAVFEAGEVAQSVRDWGHVRMFTPFAMNRSPLVTAVCDLVGFERGSAEPSVVLPGQRLQVAAGAAA